MEASELIDAALRIRENPHIRYVAAVAGIFAIAAILAFTFLPVDSSCKRPECFRQALKECSQKSFDIYDDVPLEGKFAHHFKINGAQKLGPKESLCSIAWRLNLTSESGSSKFTSGECRLLNYQKIDMQFEWENSFDRQAIGECLRLERKLNGFGE